MGSIAYAPLARCRCRMCYQWHPTMTHIYMGPGRRMRLLEKLRAYGLEITPTDPYPKTICERCIEVLEHNFYFEDTLKLIPK